MKRATGVMLAFVLALSLMSGLRVQVQAAAFTDVADTYANAKAAIEKWSDLGIVSGIGEDQFGPQLFFRRYQIAVMLDKIMGYTQSTAGKFTDLDDNPYASYILRCTAAGVFDNGGAFRPDDYITREEAALAFARALGVQYSAYDTAPSKFVDDKDISPVMRGAIKSMSALGVINGISVGDGQFAFKPKDNIKRQDMMVMFSMAIDALVNVAGESAASNKDYQRSVVINKAGASLTNSTIKGDLIISEGVGEGDVTLTDVTIEGQLIIKGGGAESVHIKGKSAINEIKVDKKAGSPISVKFADTASAKVMNVVRGAVSLMSSGSETAPRVGDVKVLSGSNITVDAAVGNIAVSGSNVTIVVTGKAADVTVGGANVTLVIKGAVATVTLSGNKANVSVEKGATVEKLVANKETKVVNEGSVALVEVFVENVTMEGTGEFKEVVKDIPSGTTTEAPPVVVAPPSGGSGGGGGGGGGGSTPSTPSTPTPPTPPTEAEYRALFISQLKSSAAIINGKANVPDATLDVSDINNLNLTINAISGTINGSIGLINEIEAYTKTTGYSQHYKVTGIYVDGTAASFFDTATGTINTSALISVVTSSGGSTKPIRLTFRPSASYSSDISITFNVTLK